MSAPGEISDEYFVNMVREWGAGDNANIYELNEKIALVKFRTETKRTQPLYIVHFRHSLSFPYKAWHGTTRKRIFRVFSPRIFSNETRNSGSGSGALRK